MSNHAQRIISSHKEAAKRATEYLDVTRKLKLKQAEALELVARVLGVANWQTLSAMAKQGQAPRLELAGADSHASYNPVDINVRARRMAQLYSVENGWKEHPFLLRENWVVCDSGPDDGLDYWRFVVRRLDEINAVMPWDREELDEVKVARAGGIDIDFDFDGEDWGIASAEDDEFLDLEVQPSEAEAWRVAAAAVGVVVGYHLGKELSWGMHDWAGLPLEEKLTAIREAMPWVAAAKAQMASVTTPKLVPAPAITREVLLAGGFEATVRDGVEGEFLVKTMRVCEMPYAVEHIVGTWGIQRGDVATLVVDPQGFLTFSIGDEYKEEAIGLNDPDARGTLRDAGLAV